MGYDFDPRTDQCQDCRGLIHWHELVVTEYRGETKQHRLGRGIKKPRGYRQRYFHCAECAAKNWAKEQADPQRYRRYRVASAYRLPN